MQMIWEKARFIPFITKFLTASTQVERQIFTYKKDIEIFDFPFDFHEGREAL